MSDVTPHFIFSNFFMAKQNSNKWMIATVALSGVIIGIAIGIGISQLPFFKARVNQGAAVAEQQKGANPLAPPGVSSVPAVTAGDHVRGPANAKITFIEYSDPECPYCKKFHESLVGVTKAYPNDVRWVYRHYPIDSNHKKARNEAEALECAGSVGGESKFWEYLDRMMIVTPGNDRLPSEDLPKIADFIKIDVNKFNTCLKAAPFAQKVQSQVTEAEQAGADGTPYTVLITPDGKRYPIAGYVDVKSLTNAVVQILKS